MLHNLHGAPEKHPKSVSGIKPEELIPLGGAQPLYSGIKVPGGWITVKDIKVGSIVTAFDGTPSRVTYVYSLGKVQLYRITFVDGRHVDCGANNLWKIFNIQKQQWKIVTSGDIIKLLNEYKYKLYINLCLSEQINNIKLPISPYTFGTIIGNESFININSAVNEDILKSLNLYDINDRDLFIPEIYLRSSHNQRLALLRGLLDTNGIIVGDVIQYDTASENLAKDITYLARSLGNICRISNKTVNDYDSKQSMNVHILNIKSKNPYSLFISSAYRNMLDKYYTSDLMLRITDIQELDKKECKRIQIDRQDGLYITDDFIVTHT
jgi:intein/homing endonuclease